MVRMTLDRPVIVKPTDKEGTLTIKEIETTFNLPLLTIIPLNSLAVDSVDIIFEMEVKSSYSDETTETRETERKAAANVDTKLGWSFLCVVTVTGHRVATRIVFHRNHSARSRKHG